MKPNSGHDAKILRGIFTGFLHRAYTVCEGEHLEEEKVQIRVKVIEWHELVESIFVHNCIYI